jgi:hypothetical protein
MSIKNSNDTSWEQWANNAGGKLLIKGDAWEN